MASVLAAAEWAELREIISAINRWIASTYNRGDLTAIAVPRSSRLYEDTEGRTG